MALDNFSPAPHSLDIMFPATLTAESYRGRLTGASVYFYAAMAEWLKAPGCNSGPARAGIVGSNPARRTIVALLTALVASVATMAALVAILLP